MQAHGSRCRYRVWRFALSASQILWECEGADVFTRARRQIIRSALPGKLARTRRAPDFGSPEGGVVPRAKSPHVGFLDETSLTPMAESPAETARIQMQSDRARGVSLRPCPALCLPSFRGYPARLSGSAFCCIYTKAPKTPAQPLAPLGRTCSGHPRLPGRLPEPRSKTWVAGTPSALWNSRFRSTGQLWVKPRLSMIIEIIK